MTTTQTQTSKFIVSSSVLLKALKAIGFANNEKAIVPITKNVRMDWSDWDNQLRLDTTDLNLAGHISMPVEAGGDGRLCIPYSKLVSLLSELAEQPITLLMGDPHVLRIMTDNGKYTLVGENDEDWPKAQVFPKTTLSLRTQPLLDAVAQVLPFCSTDDLRPAMTGVHLTLHASELAAVATNGHILARRVVTLTSDDWSDGQAPDKPLTCILSAHQAKAIVGVQKPAEWADLDVSHSHLRVSKLTDAGLSVTGKLIDGVFPDFRAVLTPTTKRMDIGRSDLQHALARLNLVCNPTTKMIRVSLTRNTITLSAEDTYNNDGSEKLLCDYEGDPIEIGVNLSQLRTCLDSFNTKMIQLGLTLANKPIYVRPTDLSTDDQNLSLTMPLQLPK